MMIKLNATILQGSHMIQMHVPCEVLYIESNCAKVKEMRFIIGIYISRCMCIEIRGYDLVLVAF